MDVDAHSCSPTSWIWHWFNSLVQGFPAAWVDFNFVVPRMRWTKMSLIWVWQCRIRKKMGRRVWPTTNLNYKALSISCLRRVAGTALCNSPLQCSVLKTSLWPQVDQKYSTACWELKNPEKVRGNLVRSLLLREFFIQRILSGEGTWLLQIWKQPRKFSGASSEEAVRWQWASAWCCEVEEGEGGNQQFSGGARDLAVKTVLIFGLVSPPATPVLTRRATPQGAESGWMKVITLRLWEESRWSQRSSKCGGD